MPHYRDRRVEPGDDNGWAHPSKLQHVVFVTYTRDTYACRCFAS
jgi:hypothetical protein